jgi:hypothetical protein
MSSIQIDVRKVDSVVKDAAHAISANHYHVAEVITGLAELMGRTIVAQHMTPIAMRELAQHALNHLESTITAGVAASGGNTERLFK